MKPLFVLSRLLLPFLSAVSVSSAAATIQIQPLEDPVRRGALSAIYIEGSISPGLTEGLVEALDAHNVKGGIVYFDSNGGDLRESLKLGQFLRQAGFDTGIGKRQSHTTYPAPASCESACVLAFAGGKYRFALDRSFIGIHRFYARSAGDHDLTLGQVVSADIITHLINMGVSPSLFPKMVSAGSEMQKLPISDALALGLINNGVGESAWRVHGSSGYLHLKGDHDSWAGSGTLDMRCGAKGQVRLNAFFTSSDFAAGELAEFSVPMLKVDGKLIGVEAQTGRAMGSGSTAQASAILNLPTIGSLTSSKTIGFSWHHSDPRKSFSFEIPTTHEKELIRSFLSHCTI